MEALEVNARWVGAGWSSAPGSWACWQGPGLIQTAKGVLLHDPKDLWFFGILDQRVLSYTAES